MSRKIREAKLSDMAEILKVMDAAKKIMRQSGNMLQWGEGYPSEKVIAADMEKDGGFVIEEEDRIIAYFAFLPSPEPTYKVIYEGKWMDDELSYHVIHRIASAEGSKGVLKAILQYCFQHTDNIRIDTHRDNVIMRHLLGKLGFTYCGIIYLANGDERLAYQRLT